jgi:hypothetical protein
MRGPLAADLCVQRRVNRRSTVEVRPARRSQRSQRVGLPEIKAPPDDVTQGGPNHRWYKPRRAWPQEPKAPLLPPPVFGNPKAHSRPMPPVSNRMRHTAGDVPAGLDDSCCPDPQAPSGQIWAAGAGFLPLVAPFNGGPRRREARRFRSACRSSTGTGRPGPLPVRFPGRVREQPAGRPRGRQTRAALLAGHAAEPALGHPDTPGSAICHPDVLAEQRVQAGRASFSPITDSASIAATRT